MNPLDGGLTSETMRTMRLILVSLVLFLSCLLVDGNEASGGQKKSSFSRYVEYAETPFSRPSYFSVPYRQPPNNRLQFIPGDMFAHLVREHVRHQQRLRFLQERRQQAAAARDGAAVQVHVQDPNAPILRGVSRIDELRQTPYRRFTHNSTSSMTYEEKRRRWKAEMKNKLRGQKTPPRPIGAPPPTPNVVGTAGRYFITFNPNANAYQVSRRLPSYVKLEELDDSVKPDNLLPTHPPTIPMSRPPTTSTTTTTTTTTTPPPPVVITQETLPIAQEVEQSVRVPAAPKSPHSSSIHQILNLDYYDDDFAPMDDSYEQEATIGTTPSPAITTRPPTTTTTSRPTTTTTRAPPPTRPPTTRPPPTRPPTNRPPPPPPTTTVPRQLVYPTTPLTTPSTSTTTTTTTTRPPHFPPIQSTRSLFASYEDEDEAADEEDDEDFVFFKPGGGRQQPNGRPLPAPTSDPFRIFAHDPTE
ncbi:hypothetical protein M3Y99_00268200 [Aphelenchoides fujianensis]|nr:hypothetical protein M3Y99_00268200 [Aphelenchoides fujianensis]